MRRIWVPTNDSKEQGINCWIADGTEVRFYPKSATGFREAKPSRNSVEDLERMVKDGMAKELPDHVNEPTSRMVERRLD